MYNLVTHVPLKHQLIREWTIRPLSLCVCVQYIASSRDRYSQSVWGRSHRTSIQDPLRGELEYAGQRVLYAYGDRAA
jgi:hypothetical protein